ncbi:DUF397 domain-containing protein [Actinomadura scrupuli]|uniref:DUF397 domain-containing protein n=1 Tax=Actinomadura scrupuli TaxID=559629 RepID=UPI003D966801
MTNVDLSRAQWHKSSHSTVNGECVEAAAMILIRNSNDPAGPTIACTPEDWRTFLGQVRTSDYDTAGPFTITHRADRSVSIRYLTGTEITYTAAEWQAFEQGVRTSDFTLL